MTNPKEFKMRRNEIILVISVLINFLVWGGTWIWQGAIVTKEIKRNTEYREKHADISACVDSNTHWIDHNRDLPNRVLINQIDLKYFGKEMEKLTDQLAAVNKNLTWFRNYKKSAVEGK